MNRKISLLIATILGQGLIGETYAEAPAQKPVQLYVGLSGGVEQLKGHQSDSLSDPGSVPSPRVFSNNITIPSNDLGVAVSGMTGFLWKIPQIPFSIGPEIYIGRGDRKSTFRVAYFDNFVGENRAYSSTINRKSFYGILLRAGVNFCQDYFAYLSGGADFGNFSITRSMTKDSGLPDTNTSIVQTTKTFTGFLYGVGLEKKMGSFKAGLDLKGINYVSKFFSDQIPTTNGVPGQTFLTYTAKPRIYSVSVRFSYLF